MADKIYCGTGRAVPTQYGDLMKISFHKDDINKMVAYLRDNGGDWINLVLKEKREKTEGKPTHYLEVDTWKPNNESVSEKYHPQAPPLSSDETGLPF